MKKDITKSSGVTLKTSGKYCAEDIEVVPILQEKGTVENGTITADEGYAGLKRVVVDVFVPDSEEKNVDLNMASGNQVITPSDSNKVLSKVTVNKPTTLVAANIKQDVEIGGVVGTLKTRKTEQEKSVTIIENGTTEVTPDSGKVLSKVNLSVNVPSSSGGSSDLAQKIVDKTVTEISAEDLEGVTSIGSYAFYGCTSLTSITIPENVTSIGNYAFGYCSALMTITMQSSTPPTLSSTAFYSTSALAQIIVPMGSAATYKAATNWSSYASIIVEPLATPQNVSVDGITASWDEVENAEEYEIFVDGTSIGTTVGGSSMSYTLTVNSGGGTVTATINGTAVTSYPAEIKKGDVIVITTETDDLALLSLNGEIPSPDDFPLEMAAQDIVWNDNIDGEMSPSMGTDTYQITLT